MVNKEKKYIKIGDIFQVVLSQRFETNLSKKPLEIYKKLRVTNPSPFMYFFNFNDFQNRKGAVIQTIILKIDVIVHNQNKNEVNLFVRRSFSQHLFSWMNDSASRL